MNTSVYLYVEDDPLSREVMQMIIENGMGVERLIMFEDSADFLARLKALSPQPTVILLDIHVQPYDGFEMLSMLRADPVFSKTPVVALTASVMNEEIKRLQNSGFDGAIAKPLSILTFPKLMSRILKGDPVWYIA